MRQSNPTKRVADRLCALPPGAAWHRPQDRAYCLDDQCHLAVVPPLTWIKGGRGAPTPVVRHAPGSRTREDQGVESELAALASASTSRTEIRRGSSLLMVPIASSCFSWRLTVSKRRPR